MTQDSSFQTTPFGFLPCYKPHGMTSRDLVNRVQRRMRLELGLRKLKVGHTGTLDPLAEGVVVVAIGATTRLTPWMLQHTKRYTGWFQLGASSISGDLEEPVEAHPELPKPSLESVTNAVLQINGWIKQTPPSHSAIWVDGERAHERTRRGENVVMPTRDVFIESIAVLAYEFPRLELDVRCGSGTYLRTLGIDIAQECGTRAVMTGLVRTEVGPFRLADATPAEAVMDPVDWTPDNPIPQQADELSPTVFQDALQPAAIALRYLRPLELDPDQATRVRNGLGVDGTPKPAPEPLSPDLENPPSDACLSNDGSSNDEPPTSNDAARSSDIVGLDKRGHLVALLRRKRGQWYPFRVFPPAN